MTHASVHQNLFEIEVSRDSDDSYRASTTVGNEVLQVTHRPMLKTALYDLVDEMVTVLSE